MAPVAWRNRFSKRDRFQKLGDDDDEIQDDSMEFGSNNSYHRQSSHATTTSSVNSTPSSNNSFTPEKPMVTPSSYQGTSIRKFKSLVSAPETPSTVASSTMGSPTSPVKELRNSLAAGRTPITRSSLASSGSGKQKLMTDPLSMLVNSKRSPTGVVATTLGSPLKHNEDDDLVEIYEAEETSSSIDDGIISPYTASAELDRSLQHGRSVTTHSQDDDEVENDDDDDDGYSDNYSDENSQDFYVEETKAKAPLLDNAKSSKMNTEDIVPPETNPKTTSTKSSTNPFDDASGVSSKISKSSSEAAKSATKKIPPLPPPRQKSIAKIVVVSEQQDITPVIMNKKPKNNENVDIDDDDDDDDDENVVPIELEGVDVIMERDHSRSELQEVSHLMAFNALILIQKQKDWLAGSSTKATSLMIELENMERKIKLLSDTKQWPNETERKKQQVDPLTPSKAFFKAMSLLDRSIEQFHQGYLQFTAKTSQENHDLKRQIESLEAKNSTLLQETQTQKVTMQDYENERNEYAKQVKRMEDHLSLVKVQDDENDAATTISGNTFLAKVFDIKSYIESLEENQRNQQEVIEALKNQLKNSKMEPVEEAPETDKPKVEEEPEIAKSSSADSGFLDDDLGSRWHTLQANEEATEKAAEKERQVSELCAKLADREKDLSSLRSECKLIRMQLLQEESTRNEFKSQLAEKDSALSVAEQRIANLEEEVLKTHARCATYEEDYAALKESFATQKEATLKELGTTQEDNKTQLEKVQTEYDVKLQSLEERLNEEKAERERLVRDLKASVSDVEGERDELQKEIESLRKAQEVAAVKYDGEEKKEPEVEEVKAVEADKLKKLEEELQQFERMRERLAEKACTQATTIATLQEQNENKDAQLTSLQEMIEMLLQEREAAENTGAAQLRQRMTSLRERVMDRADQMKEGGLFNRSQHGN